MKIKTREEWLHLVAANYLWPMMKQAGQGEVKTHRISVGFPKGSRGGKGAKAIGQCWHGKTSEDGSHAVFVSPILGDFDAVHVLLHELIHVAVGLECGHKGAFKRLARACGLTGKMTATHPDEGLTAKIGQWLRELPDYPHARMIVTDPEKKPGSRLIKAACPECRYTVRLSQSWIDVAAPICPDRDCEGYGQEMVTG